MPRRIFVSTPPLRININIKIPARQEVGGPSQIGIQSSSFAADTGLGLGLGRGLGPFGCPLPRVHVRVLVVFVNAGEEARSSSSCTPSSAPVRRHLCGHSIRSSRRSHIPAAAAAERPPLQVFLLRVLNDSVDGLLLRARNRSQSQKNSCNNAVTTEEIGQPVTPL